MDQQKEHVVRYWFGTVFGVVIGLIVLPILVLNLTLIVRSCISAGQVPEVGGYLPLIVLSDSMYPDIRSGDLIICRTTDPKQIEVGDVISYFESEGDDSGVVSHRVISIVEEDGQLSFRTKGDANSTADEILVPAEKLVGVCQRRIAGAGKVALFMQTTTGRILCVVLPLVLLAAYSFAWRRFYKRCQKADIEELMKELEALRAAKEEVC